MSDSSAPLPTTLAGCHALIEELRSDNATMEELQSDNATLKATIEQQQDALHSLQRDLATMKRMIFGQRRERFEDSRQGTLFDSMEVGKPDSADDISQESELELSHADTVDKKTPKRQGRSRRVFPACLPREKRVHELTDEEIPEEMRGENFRRFLKKSNEWIEYAPPKLTVIEEFVEVVAMNNDDATETTMVSARRPERILNCFAGPSLLAALTVNHFSDHLPFYRLEDILKRSKLVIDRSTQCRWMQRLSKQLAPLTNLMRTLSLQSPVVHADETPIRMLDPGRGKTAATYLWAVLGDQQHPYTTFTFTESRERAGPVEALKDYSGIVVSDAYTGYEYLHPYTQGRIRLAGCFAHARRKFETLHDLGPTEQTSTAMGYFQRLFDIEQQLRESSDDERHEHRQLHSRPLLSEFKTWMDKQLETLRPKHDLRGAINYMTSRWECFERFLESGAIALDNNSAEQAVKNPVMGKKAWLFFGSPAGGHSAAVFYGLTATCRRLRIDPYAYLKDVFMRLPTCDVEDKESLAPLLPDRWLAEHPHHQLQNRVNEANNKATQKRNRRAQRKKALIRAQRSS